MLVVGLGLFFVGLLFPSGLASAEATSIAFAGAFYPCLSTDFTEVRIGGNVLHLGNGTNHNLWVTGNPLVDGFADNVVNAEINLKTGNGVAHARESLKPSAVDGRWESVVQVRIDASGLTAQGSGRGTGDLLGLTMQFTVGAQTPVAPGENPCSDDPNNSVSVALQGEIIGRAA